MHVKSGCNSDSRFLSFHHCRSQRLSVKSVCRFKRVVINKFFCKNTGVINKCFFVSKLTRIQSSRFAARFEGISRLGFAFMILR